MKTQKPLLNRILLISLVTLYIVTIAAFNYAEWIDSPGRHHWIIMGLNTLILSIPLVPLFGSIYLLVIAWREHSTLGRVNPRLAKIIRWAPRAAVILIIFFVSLFSLDIYEIQASPLELLGVFLMHNIPSIIMIVLLIFAWKRPMVGFVGFLAVAVLFGILLMQKVYSFSNLLIFAFPILLIAFLFFADWLWLKPLPAAPIDPAE